MKRDALGRVSSNWKRQQNDEQGAKDSALKVVEAVDKLNASNLA